MVAAAIELAGGPTAVAELCGVRRQSVYVWIKEWKVERLVDALKLSRASGIPIEKLAGYAFDSSETRTPGRGQLRQNRTEIKRTEPERASNDQRDRSVGGHHACKVL